jgi:hypothetical protein
MCIRPVHRGSRAGRPCHIEAAPTTEATTPAAPAATSISSTTASNQDRILSSSGELTTCPFTAMGSMNGMMFLFVTGPQGRAGIGSRSCVCSFLQFTVHRLGSLDWRFGSR